MNPSQSLLVHLLVSLLSVLVPHLLHLPSLLLLSLHTYLHPDHLPSSSSSSSDSIRAAIRRPGATADSDPNNPKPKSRSRSKPSFDESRSQLLRLRLSHHHLLTRLLFPNLHRSLLLLSLSLSNLLLLLFSLSTSSSSPLLPSLSSSLTLLYLLSSLFSASLHSSSLFRSASLLASLSAFLLAFFLLQSSSVFTPGFSFIFDLLLSALCGAVSGLLYTPAARAARSFWLGTDQLRWNLSIVSCGPLARLLLYMSAIASFVAPLLFFLVEETWRFGVLLAWAVLQLLVLRPNLQMYLNEGVLCWYQSLHASVMPDLDYGRAKVFLHDRYVCVVGMQFLGQPAMVMLLLGVSRMRGNLFVAGGFEDLSDFVRECALFLAWWVVLVWGVFMMGNLALYRLGVLIVS